MFKVMAFLTKRPDISRAELIAHYEQHHVPLVLSLAPAPRDYRRNYAQLVAGADADALPDIVTELVFDDQASYESWVAVMYAPDSGVAADEETFLDRGRTASICVEEFISTSLQ